MEYEKIAGNHLVLHCPSNGIKYILPEETTKELEVAKAKSRYPGSVWVEQAIIFYKGGKIMGWQRNFDIPCEERIYA